MSASEALVGEPSPRPRSGGLWSLRAASEELLHTDLMRFIASVGIVLTHTVEFMLPRGERIQHGGGGLALFVDVFFVMSGFVIAHVYAGRIGGWRDFGRFMQRRVGRLVPLHLATLVVSALFFAGVYALGYRMAHPVSLSAQCLTTAALLIHAMVPCGGNVPNGVSWSISAEMLMYLMFPLLLAVRRLAGAAAILVFAGLFVMVLWHYGGFPQWTTLDAWRALPAFFLGMVLQGARGLLARIPQAWPLAVAVTAAFVVGSFLGWSTAVLLPLAYLGAALALAADCAGKGGPLVARLAPLGQLTYSIYMIHMLIIVPVLNALADKLLKLPPAGLTLVTLACYPVILVVSLASFKLLETPARRWIDSLPLFAPPRAGRPGENARV